MLLLVFGGFLLAVLLRGLANLLAAKIPALASHSYAVVIATLAALSAFICWSMFNAVATELDKLLTALPDAFQHVRDYLVRYRWGQWVVDQHPIQGVIGGAGSGQVGKVALNAADAVIWIVVVIFIGIYLGAEPGLYRDGALRLFPERYRHKATAIFDRSYTVLWWWLVGRAIAMIAVGLLNWIGLHLLGVPLASILGLIAGLLTFIPNLGAVIAVIPAGLLALTVRPKLVLYVILLHFALQAIEGYVLTPFVQRRTIRMPPALLITVQVIFGELIGFTGLTFAVPITAVAIVVIKMLYLKDTLGQPVNLPEREAP